MTPTPPRRRRRASTATALGVVALLGGLLAYEAWRVRQARKPGSPDGVLSVRSDPPGAQVTVEGRSIPGRTPLFARGVRRGVPLAVEVTRAGYRAWRGIARVRTDFGDGVLLVKLEPVAAASAPASAPSAPAAAPAAAPAPAAAGGAQH